MELLDHFKIFSSLIFGSIAITGCFDKSTDVIDDPKVSISESKEASHNSDDANKVTSDQKKDMGMVATSSTNNDNSIQADNGFIKVASKDPGQAAFDEFMNSSFATELPTTKPDSKALSQTSMDEEKINLKIASLVPSKLNTGYSDEWIERVKCENNSSNYFCSTKYLKDVQKSKNRIILSKNEEVVISLRTVPSEGDEPTELTLSYVKNGVVYPTNLHPDNFGDHGFHNTRYARVNGEACIYAKLTEEDGRESSNLYNCFIPSDNLNDSMFSSLAPSKNNVEILFSESDLDKIEQTSYKYFSEYKSEYDF
ncbi:MULTISPECIES: hypothetical protein [unclassified Psychrobacter]|uniref:hypothetical protein n=1 Tax=unclassified Psychrobacter TaxID=196806 RepID=UPI001917D1B2|nr:hypothetical protein [Psychrobacter sp. Pi2-52]